MDPVRLRAALAAFLIALVAGLVAASPALDTVRGLSIDFLTALRWRAFGNAHAPASSPAVVVALDEETFRTPPFDGTPSVTWTREIGQVLTAVIDGGAKVVGFDIVFPTSIEQSAVPFGDETLGARVRGFDRDYLRALALGARAGKVVLGQVQHQDQPALAVARPARRGRIRTQHPPAQRLQRSRRRDPPRAAQLRGRRRAGALDGGGACRARHRRHGGASETRAVAASMPNTITLNFAGGADDIPTFSLADLRACAEKDDKDFFRRHFDGKVVLIGTVLDVEDRKITSKRFATAPEGARGGALRAAARPRPARSSPATRSPASTSTPRR